MCVSFGQCLTSCQSDLHLADLMMSGAVFCAPLGCPMCLILLAWRKHVFTCSWTMVYLDGDLWSSLTTKMGLRLSLPYSYARERHSHVCASVQLFQVDRSQRVSPNGPGGDKCGITRGILYVQCKVCPRPWHIAVGTQDNPVIFVNLLIVPFCPYCTCFARVTGHLALRTLCLQLRHVRATRATTSPRHEFTRTHQPYE